MSTLINKFILNNVFVGANSATIHNLGAIVQPHDLQKSSVLIIPATGFTSSSVLISLSKELSSISKHWISQIQNFANLQENWDSYGAVVPTLKAIRRASSLVQQLDFLNLDVFFAAPGPSGEIVIEAKWLEKSIEFYVEDAGEIEYCQFVEDDCVQEGSLQDRGLKEIVAWLRAEE